MAENEWVTKVKTLLLGVLAALWIGRVHLVSSCILGILCCSKSPSNDQVYQMFKQILYPLHWTGQYSPLQVTFADMFPIPKMGYIWKVSQHIHVRTPSHIRHGSAKFCLQPRRPNPTQLPGPPMLRSIFYTLESGDIFWWVFGQSSPTLILCHHLLGDLERFWRWKNMSRPPGFFQNAPQKK